MAAESREDPTFRITHDAETGESLLAGFSAFGLAGLTAVDYLTDQLDLGPTGHITAEGLPSITPFTNGRPRHHTRLYSRSDLDVTVLVGELFVPVQAADTFSRAVLEWTDHNAIDEVAVLSGIPIAHGPDDHGPYYISTEDYHGDRLEGTDLTPMGTGFLDGVNASLVERGMDTELGVGVFVTPVHAQAPDVEAALRLVDTVNDTYDLGVDSEPLTSFAEQIRKHYEGLAERIEERESDGAYDRMYM
jgi:uncharacterized protein